MKKNIIGVGVSDVSKEEVLEYIIQNIRKKTKKYYIVTPNPEILVMANNDFRYKKVLNSADLALADGIGVILAGKLLGRPLKERIPGADFVKILCEMIAKQPITVSFLGGRPKIAEMTAECLRREYPGLKVRFAGADIPSDVNKLASDLLFVAFGSPKQEFWIAENLNRLPIKAAMGVGGAFDFISGAVKRAPAWIRALGLEWLYRLIRQPWRARRQLSLLTFAFLVIRERLR
ncbi:MAG TPA: WecB/TagA/CpsF family glycosyltransferase [Patescibacteria group bacterium]|nr:WecB/TagA/CpsF family glycosyltransferase [Patescibacteria group bacterium]